MAAEPRPGSTHPGRKRPQDETVFWVDESKRIPLLVNQVPAKSRRTRRTQLRARAKKTYSPYKACGDSHLALGQIKFQPEEELDSIRRELNGIKTQVDSLLESLESMEQQRDRDTAQEQRMAKRTGVLEVRAPHAEIGCVLGARGPTERQRARCTAQTRSNL